MHVERTLAEDLHHPSAAALARHRLARKLARWLARRLAARLAVGAVACAVIAAPADGQDAPAEELPHYFANLPDLPPIVGHAAAWDGDTLHFVELDIRVRLHAVAAPEMGEWPWGPWARALVDDMINGDPVTCRPTGDESHRRPVAICGTDRIPDIGRALIAAGLATEHRAYSGAGLIGEAYRSAEFAARRDGRGVWFGWTPADAD